MDLGLKDKVAIVTGASRGIGRGIALGLAREGCKLAICARGADALTEAAEEMRGAGADVLELALDLTQPDEADRLIDETVARFGAVDVLVNNIGGNRRGAMHELSDDDWAELLNLNFTCHVRVSRAAVPHLRKGDGGSIVFISSIFGREAGGAGLAIYNSTKSAMLSLAKIMAMDYARDGIRVNTVAPGSIRFPGGSWDKRCIADPDGMAEFTDKNLPLGRFGTVEEIANVVAFLSSEKASLVTGACLNVDGCQSRSLI